MPCSLHRAKGFRHRQAALEEKITPLSTVVKFPTKEREEFSESEGGLKSQSAAEGA